MTSRLRARLPLLLTAILHVVFLIAQAPHTVHHFFEPEVEQQNECAFAAAAERSTGATATSISLAPLAGVELPVTAVSVPLFARPVVAVSGPRAPPVSAA